MLRLKTKPVVRRNPSRHQRQKQRLQRAPSPLEVAVKTWWLKNRPEAKAMALAGVLDDHVRSLISRWERALKQGRGRSPKALKKELDGILFPGR